MNIRTRFAPSPTGNLHIAGIRTVLYCYAMAKKHSGQFILRIEDTDQKRKIEGSVEKIFDLHTKYGLEPDESINHGGEFGPYVQSERLELYKKYAHELVKNGHAYYSFETKEEIEEQKAATESTGEHFIFKSPYRDMDPTEAKAKVDAGESYVVRQRIEPGKTLVYEDPIQGKLEYKTDDVNEGILLKSDGFPTYHLAVVVDDHLMEISHAFRGVEWLPSLPKHILLYENLGWDMPVYAHFALILDPKGGKLSKRNGSVAAEEFLAEGYLPEAMLNFLMLIGWSSPEERVHGEAEREFYSLDEFVDLFDIKDLNKASAVFNRDKLMWFNQQYISKLSISELKDKYLAWVNEYDKDSKILSGIEEKGDEYFEKVLELTKERTKLLPDINELALPFYTFPETIDFLGTKQLKKLDTNTINSVLSEFKLVLDNVDSFDNWTHEEWEQSVRRLAEKMDLKAGQAFMTLRLGLLGTAFSPPLYESMEVIGIVEAKSRLEQAIQMVSQ